MDAQLITVIAVAVVLAALVVVLVVLGTARRSIRQLQDRVEEAWRDIEAHRRGRAAVLPVLLGEFRRVARGEQVVDLVERRLAATTASTSAAAAGVTEDGFQTAFGELLRTAEGYPELQAGAVFLQAQGDLAAIEDELQRSRRFYNGGVRELNAKAKAMPGRLVARGFEHREYFEVDAASAVAQPPKIQF